MQKPNYKQKVRERMEAYIDALEDISMNSDSDTARVRAMELLVRLADVNSMEQPEEEPIQVKRAEPLKLVKKVSEAV